MKDIMSDTLNKMVKNFKIVRDTNGMSPAKVFSLSSEGKNCYLKISHKTLRGTTYDVEREKNVLEWLDGKIEVPKVLHFEEHNGYTFLLMSEAKGRCLDFEDVVPELIVKMYVDSINKIQSIDISSCSFDSSINKRLLELDYLFKNGLSAEDDFHHGDTPFSTPIDWINYLKENIPKQELVFSHGNLSGGNIFIKKTCLSKVI